MIIGNPVRTRLQAGLPVFGITITTPSVEARWVGRLLVFGLSVVVLSALARSARHLRAARRGHGLTLLGLAFLACFVVLRSAGYLPFLHDVNVRFKDVLHVVFELGGVMLVGASALRASPRRQPPQLEHE